MKTLLLSLLTAGVVLWLAMPWLKSAALLLRAWSAGQATHAGFSTSSADQ
jgi:hypothetical protein